MLDEPAQEAGANSLPLQGVLDQNRQLSGATSYGAAARQGDYGSGRGRDQREVLPMPGQGLGEVRLGEGRQGREKPQRPGPDRAAGQHLGQRRPVGRAGRPDPHRLPGWSGGRSPSSGRARVIVTGRSPGRGGNEPCSRCEPEQPRCRAIERPCVVTAWRGGSRWRPGRLIQDGSRVSRLPAGTWRVPSRPRTSAGADDCGKRARLIITMFRNDDTLCCTLRCLLRRPADPIPGSCESAGQRRRSIMGTLVTYRLHDAVATITLDDGKVNVLSLAMLTELGAALDRAEADRALVVLTGREGVFSAGFDLAVLRAGGTEAADLLRAGFDLAARLLAFPAPVLVACTGHAVAMGVFLALSGDYRIGARGPYKITAI